MAALLQLAMANTFWVWAALAAACLALEVVSGSGWLLWPAASAGVVAILSLAVRLEPVVALLVFAALTIAGTYLARRFWPRHGAEDHDINDTTVRLIGHHGHAVGGFAGREGRVFIDGKEWAAELDAETAGEALARGAAVEVTGVSGARLRVRAAG